MPLLKPQYSPLYNLQLLFPGMPGPIAHDLLPNYDELYKHSKVATLELKAWRLARRRLKTSALSHVGTEVRAMSCLDASICRAAYTRQGLEVEGVGLETWAQCGPEEQNQHAVARSSSTSLSIIPSTHFSLSQALLTPLTSSVPTGADILNLLAKNFIIGNISSLFLAIESPSLSHLTYSTFSNLSFASLSVLARSEERRVGKECPV